ncbi:MAG TPA: cytosine permease [Oculatellaceae cyanobacterium]
MQMTLAHSADAQDHVVDQVPLSERRGPVTMGLLWVTMVTGFPSVLVGFEWYKAQLSLSQVLQGVVVSCLILLAYGIPATYLGSKSGLSYSILSRKVFGAWGSRLVSFNLVWISVAWYGLNAMFLADALKGIYHFDIPSTWFAVALALAMAVNNMFGFSGIANFARYFAAPVLILWVGYTFCKVLPTCPITVFTACEPHSMTFALSTISAFVVGYSVWGNEADYWRYSRPKKMLSAIPLLGSLVIGQIMFPVTGWMLARLTGITEAGPATELMNQYAFGGFSIIAAVVLVVSYFAVNDSGLYGAINGIENLKEWPRRHVVASLAITGAIAAYWLASCSNAFEVVATLSSIMLPGATIIMLFEYFWFRRGNESTDTFSVSAFEHLPSVQPSAVWSLFSGITVGVATSGLIPGLQSLHIGICSLQSWIACGLVYLTLRSLELAQAKRQKDLLESQFSLSPLG